MNNPASYRRRAKLTQEQLAKELGISRSYYALLETGRRTWQMPDFIAWVDILHLTNDEAMTVARKSQSNK